MLSSPPRPQFKVDKKAWACFLRNRAFILHADPLPLFISSTLIFGGKGFESRSVRFWSGHLFCKNRYQPAL